MINCGQVSKICKKSMYGYISVFKKHFNKSNIIYEWEYYGA